MLMAKLSDIESAVAQLSGVVDSAVALIKGLHDRISTANGESPEAVQKVLDSIQAESNELAAAVAANTPAAPEAPPAEAAPADAPAPEAAAG